MIDFWLPVAVLVFGTIILVTEMLTKTQGWGTGSIRIVGLTIVVVAVLFLTVAFSQSSTPKELPAAAFGLLGVVAGYVAGKEKD